MSVPGHRLWWSKPWPLDFPVWPWPCPVIMGLPSEQWAVFDTSYPHQTCPWSSNWFPGQLAPAGRQWDGALAGEIHTLVALLSPLNLCPFRSSWPLLLCREPLVTALGAPWLVKGQKGQWKCLQNWIMWLIVLAGKLLENKQPQGIQKDTPLIPSTMKVASHNVNQI